MFSNRFCLLFNHERPSYGKWAKDFNRSVLSENGTRINLSTQETETTFMSKAYLVYIVSFRPTGSA